MVINFYVFKACDGCGIEHGPGTEIDKDEYLCRKCKKWLRDRREARLRAALERQERSDG